MDRRTNQAKKTIFDNTVLNPKRTSGEIKINNKDKGLVNCFELKGFHVLNGRSPSDTPANYTYIGQRGQSIIDFVWVNINALPMINDFNVSCEINISDHLICEVYIDNGNHENLQTKSNNGTLRKSQIVTRWDIFKIGKYKEYLECELENLF